MPRKRWRKRRSKKISAKQDVVYLLDQFSRADLRTWQLKADRLQEYYVRLFYHLESLRNLYHDELCEALHASQAISHPFEEWTRIVDYRYSLDPLSAKGSLIKGGRFNIGSDLDPGKYPTFSALYIAEDYETAFLEKFGALDKANESSLTGYQLALRKPESFTSVRISGTIYNVFNLRRQATLNRFVDIINSFDMPDDLKALATSLGFPKPWLITTPAVLKNNLLDKAWRNWPTLFGIPPNSQVFGRLLIDVGYEGIIYPSTKGQKNCLAIFLDNFASTESYVELSDKPPTGAHHVRLDAQTWRELV